MDTRSTLPHVKQRRVCLDIGAHIGTWTVLLARVFESVVAFEPDTQNFIALTRNLVLSGVKNVRALPLAVAHRSGRFCLSHEGTINCGEGYLTPFSEGDEWVIGLRLDDAQLRCRPDQDRHRGPGMGDPGQRRDQYPL